MAKRQKDTSQPLSRLNVLDTEFLVDFERNEIRQAGKPVNILSFDQLKYDNNLEGFPLAFDRQTKKIHSADDPAISSRHTEQILIPDLLVLGRTDILHSAIALNGRTQTPERSQEEILNKHGFTKITLSNTEFLVDGPSRVLRQTRDRSNTIAFDKLKYDEAQGGYPIVFDKLNKNIYRGYLPKAGMPPMTERIVIPRMNAIENFRLIKPDKIQRPEKELQRVRSGRKANKIKR